MTNKIDDPVLQDIFKAYFDKAQTETPKAPSQTLQDSDTGSIDYRSILNKYLGNPTSLTFDDFADKTLGLEGGFTVDQGGPTMRGVTWRDNKKELRQLGYTEETLKDLTPEDAKKLYKVKYYEKPGLNALPEDIQHLAFDYSVNSGPVKAVKGLQKIVGAPVDGSLGPETLGKVNLYIKKFGSSELKKAYLNERKEFLKDLAKKDPKTHGGSLKGWMNRLTSIEKENNINAG